MEYSVTCSCRNVIPVTATQAGTEIACPCGRAVKVPRLSQLRLATGRDAYKSTAIEAIERFIASGELPYGDTCALCGMPTHDAAELYVECERTWQKTSEAVPWWLLWFPGALKVWLISKFLPLPTETLGRDTGVRIPLRVCQPDHGRLSRIRDQRKLRGLLHTVPIYQRLLEEYPRAHVYPDA
jgi:hypothetical protein